MVQLQPVPPQINSARPEMTRAVMRATGLDEAQLTALVHNFYAKVRRDPLLGPIFETRITDWTAHLERMVAFWSSVALMTGRYSGAPVPAHIGLPVAWDHFERWLALFEETAREVCTPEGADRVITHANHIALSLDNAIQNAS
ncbi:group III truncated hemoglobin [Rhodobacteraceae bacterium LMO-12]|nr:group III truncated hemoglobin [Rhodobacteraceae bacterium LMO-JJ12]